MAFCRKCGTDNPNDSAFCESCGAKFTAGSGSSEGGSAGDSYFGSLPPSTVIGDYEIDRELGEGGMGMVFEAHHRRLGHTVALKVLAPQLARNETLVRRFEQEARVQANLKHPNIVKCHDFIREDRLCAMVMEFVPGATLEEVIREQTGPMTTERARAVMLPVLDALGHAHDQGIVHRDIKPSNIMLAREAGRDVPKVMDFGIAKLLVDGEMGTATGSKLGTLHYMSPEQCTSSRDVDERSDIYSLGATLYEMATGRVPFDQGTDFDLMKAHMEAAPPAPRSIYPGVSERMERVILKALQKEPARRFQSVAAFAAALDPDQELPEDLELSELSSDAADAASQSSVVEAAAAPQTVPPKPTMVEASSSGAAPVVQAAVVATAGKPVALIVGIAAVAVLGLGGVSAFVLTRGDETPPALTRPAPELPTPEEVAERSGAPVKGTDKTLTPAATADLDIAEEHLKNDRNASALAQLEAARRRHGESGRQLSLLLRYHLSRTGMWSGIRKYHLKLPGSSAALGKAKAILDRLHAKYLLSLTGQELYYAATGYMFHGMLGDDSPACARGEAMASMAVKKGFSEQKYISRVYNTLGVLQALQGKTAEGDRSLRRSIKARLEDPNPRGKSLRICAAAWNLAAVPLWSSAGRLEDAMAKTQGRHRQNQQQSWWPGCSRGPLALAYLSYLSACRKQGCIQKPTELKLFFMGWSNLINGKQARGKRLLNAYLNRGGKTFSDRALTLRQKAGDCANEKGGCTEDTFLR